MNTDVLSQAKQILNQSSQLPKTQTGNPTEAFEQSFLPSKLSIPQAHEYKNAPYSLARKQRAL